ncbi:FeoA family protein [Aliiglaciecola lipolytica]|uniref:Ferrous iron transport protein A n=1 Tax=Aliiglaciecola lipolytica E3 TaxID=1127673 RepID=K6YBY8_9ALTE|nr:FeoA family protein [Aliiglaciecola lipolytica]GAC14163.1 ferrous iron transport protein A [Aliiglaciecola lipolytica E3]
MLHDTVWELPTKKVAEIVGLQSGLSDAMSNRLKEMGFCGGESIRCIKQCPFNGPKVVELGGAILSIDKEIAQNIKIKM